MNTSVDRCTWRTQSQTWEQTIRRWANPWYSTRCEIAPVGVHGMSTRHATPPFTAPHTQIASHNRPNNHFPMQKNYFLVCKESYFLLGDLLRRSVDTLVEKKQLFTIPRQHYLMHNTTSAWLKNIRLGNSDRFSECCKSIWIPKTKLETASCTLCPGSGKNSVFWICSLSVVGALVGKFQTKISKWISN